jgi:lipoprotein-anchoring transpeptidase ErfK/SrfK
MNLLMPAALFTAAVVVAPAFIQAQQTHLIASTVVPQAVLSLNTSALTSTIMAGAGAAAGVKAPSSEKQAVLPPLAVSLPVTAPLVEPPKAGEPRPNPEIAAIAPALPAAPVAPPAPVITLTARVNLSTQTMTVNVHGKPTHTFKISSGREGFITPRGTFTPGWMAKMWYSRQYDDAPMPHAVFFNSGIATHATTATGMLGRPASHGCVRLSPANAETFYKLVSRHGLKQTRIIVDGRTPAPAIARRPTNPSPFAQPYNAYAPHRGGYAYQHPSQGWGWGGPQAYAPVYVQPTRRTTQYAPAPRPRAQQRPGQQRMVQARHAIVR